MRSYLSYSIYLVFTLLIILGLYLAFGNGNPTEVKETTGVISVDIDLKEPEIIDKKPSNQNGQDVLKDSFNTSGIISAEKDSDPNYNLLLLWVAILSISASVILSFISFNLYRWRIRITAEQALFVPEAQIKRTDEQTEKLEELRRLLPAFGKMVSEKTEYILSKSSEVEDSLLQFQSSLDAKDTEIKRLKEGYDLKLYKRFLSNFFRLYKTLWRMEKEPNFPKEYSEQILMQLDDAFENAGVELFYPDAGLNFRDQNHLFKPNPKTIITHDPAKDFLVESIVSPGLRETGSKENIIIQAEVRIFAYEGE
jgi:hypothetical protein